MKTLILVSLLLTAQFASASAGVETITNYDAFRANLCNSLSTHGMTVTGILNFRAICQKNMPALFANPFSIVLQSCNGLQLDHAGHGYAGSPSEDFEAACFTAANDAFDSIYHIAFSAPVNAAYQRCLADGDISEAACAKQKYQKLNSEFVQNQAAPTQSSDNSTQGSH